MKEILDAMLAALARGERVVLCSIFASSGSSPRGAGAKMAVLEDGSTLGTVGGGAVELLCARRALEAIRTGGNELKSYDLHPNDVASIGMICGGRVTVYFQLFRPEEQADIAVLRSGKARKNDPPIPADLAPISGGGKRVRREAKEETMVLEPIRFKYSTETIVEETPAAPEAVAAPEVPAPAPGAEAADAPKPSRSRRRRGRGEGGKTTAPAPADAPKDKPRPPKPPKEGRSPEKNAEPRQSPAPRDAAGEKPARRPNNHRRGRKPRAQGDGNKGSAE